MFELVVHSQIGRRWYLLYRDEQLIALELFNLHQPRFSGSQIRGRLLSFDADKRSVLVALDTQPALTGLSLLPKKQRLTLGSYQIFTCLSEPRQGKGPKLKLAPDQRLIDHSDLGDGWIARFGLCKDNTRLRCDTPLIAGRYQSHGFKTDISPLSDGEEDLLASLRDDRVTLPNGAWLLFEPGETLTAVDLNTGTLAFEAANHSMIPVLAQQLVARNLGGTVVVDAMQLETKTQRAQFDKALRRALAPDPAILDISPISPRGLVTIERRRFGLSLDEALGLQRYRKAALETQLLDAFDAARHTLSPTQRDLPLPPALAQRAEAHPAFELLAQALGFRPNILVTQA